jgi:hypothetical protein
MNIPSSRAPGWCALLVLLASGCDGAAPTTDAGAGDAARVDTGVVVDAGPDVDGGPDRDGGGTDAAVSGECPLPVAFDVGLTYARELHVSAGASGGDGSVGSPFGSLEDAARAATPGTRIVLAAGTHHGSWYVEGLAGTATQPIAIVGDGEVILDADGAAEVLHLSEISFVVLEHLVLTNAVGNGLNIDDGGTAETPSHHVVLRDLEVHDIGSGGNNDCIKLSGLDDYFILDSRVMRCDAGDAIDHVGCHDGFIHGNYFADCVGGGIQMKGGSSDILVHGNQFVDIAGRSINAGGSTGLEFFRPIDAPFEAARLRIEANVFVRSGAAAIAFVGCDACVFANNDIFDPQRWVARILQETVDARFVPSRDGLFVNNIVVFDVADLSTFVNVGPDTAPETFTFANNLWYATDDASFAGPTLTDGIPAETGSVIQMSPAVTETMWDSCFGVPGATEGRVVSGSTADFGGRCWAAPPSIGAVQAISCTL